jgi:hypothetical protein
MMAMPIMHSWLRPAPLPKGPHIWDALIMASVTNQSDTSCRNMLLGATAISALASGVQVAQAAIMPEWNSSGEIR